MPKSPEEGPSLESQETPLNEQNWRILKAAEQSLIEEINTLGQAAGEIPIGRTEKKETWEKVRGLGLELVCVRQMMREETQNPHLEFSEVNPLGLYPINLSE